MSVKDDSENDVVHVSSVWGLLFKLFLVSVPFTLVSAMGFGVWLTGTINAHETRITVLERMTGQGPAKGPAKGVSQSVNVGAVDALAGDADRTDPHREWLTVQEVATKEAVAERTILSWIEGGTISPAPVKDGREWHIAVDYRRLPQTAAVSGTADD